jgi:hypothetical protein
MESYCSLVCRGKELVSAAKECSGFARFAAFVLQSVYALVDACAQCGDCAGLARGWGWALYYCPRGNRLEGPARGHGGTPGAGGGECSPAPGGGPPPLLLPLPPPPPPPVAAVRAVGARDRPPGRRVDQSGVETRE